jgi:hypothetical protein
MVIRVWNPPVAPELTVPSETGVLNMVISRRWLAGNLSPVRVTWSPTPAVDGGAWTGGPTSPVVEELVSVPVPVGPELAVTVKQPVHEAEAPPGLVTVTSRAPVGALEATLTLATTVVELWKVVEFTVMPVPEKAALAPDTKLVPVTVTFWAAEP